MDSQELQSLKNKYDVIGNDAALNRALETAVAIAPTGIAVLITGESGVGKDVIPKIIHQRSLRKTKSYFAVNCGAIPEGTIDSELFGHVKGSFTGATETRKGYFEEADGGTLFLDEISELPLASQAKLLRVLQSGEFIKVGSSKVEKTDVRVVAATNKDLLYAVGQGKFREDLYYRLNAVQIKMPPLRDRKDDIYLLFRKFTSDFSEKYSMTKLLLTNDAIDLLINYRWPGNVRQLKNIAETVSALEGEKLTPSSGKCIVDAATLSHYIPKDSPNAIPVTVQPQSGEGFSSADRQMFIKALLDLKAEVDGLKAKVFGTGQARSIAAPAESEMEAEWQGQGAPVTSADVQGSRVIDVRHREEPEEQESAKEDNLSIKDAEKDLIIKALQRSGGNRKLAAEDLGFSERTLYRKIEKYNIEEGPRK